MEKIVSLPGGGEKDPFAEASRSLAKNLQTYLATVDMIEQMRRAKYLAAIKHGFTSEQAFELCRTL